MEHWLVRATGGLSYALVEQELAQWKPGPEERQLPQIQQLPETALSKTVPAFPITVSGLTQKFEPSTSEIRIEAPRLEPEKPVVSTFEIETGKPVVDVKPEDLGLTKAAPEIAAPPIATPPIDITGIKETPQIAPIEAIGIKETPKIVPIEVAEIREAPKISPKILSKLLPEFAEVTEEKETSQVLPVPVEVPTEITDITPKQAPQVSPKLLPKLLPDMEETIEAKPVEIPEILNIVKSIEEIGEEEREKTAEIAFVSPKAVPELVMEEKLKPVTVSESKGKPIVVPDLTPIIARAQKRVVGLLMR